VAKKYAVGKRNSENDQKQGVKKQRWGGKKRGENRKTGNQLSLTE